jgi:hypothetical protein
MQCHISPNATAVDSSKSIIGNTSGPREHFFLLRNYAIYSSKFTILGKGQKYLNSSCITIRSDKLLSCNQCL